MRKRRCRVYVIIAGDSAFFGWRLANAIQVTVVGNIRTYSMVQSLLAVCTLLSTRPVQIATEDIRRHVFQVQTNRTESS